ncbi:flagellar assembly protein FliW [Halobacillus salinus]|uniref:Flagellar assembly factor FliW n=1 Tax=Halobacillus salinus TaxID=192814 RepID=A0A4Z0H049_9BACI|nr:flagellar assembly protein FliW [Halobacillus salinus]TGB02368.1 flagellar assembly protein FliW [Halobacillus salinus]
MQISTKYFGSIEVDEKELIQFKHGLPGFGDYRSFVHLPLEEAPLYSVLQSVDEHGLAFVVVNPYVFYKDYEFVIDEQTKKELDLQSPEEVDLYCVMTLQDPFDRSTMNLQAPIIVNKTNHRAKQMILNDPKYHTKHSLQLHKEEGGTHAHP